MKIKAIIYLLYPNLYIHCDLFFCFCENIHWLLLLTNDMAMHRIIPTISHADSLISHDITGRNHVTFIFK